MEGLKLSKYLVTSPVFYDNSDNRQKCLIFSTITTEILLLDSGYNEILKSGEWNHLPESVINELVLCKVLVKSDENELLSIINFNKKAIDNDSILSFVIQPTAQCQLGCDYCGQAHSNKIISTSLKQKVIERFKSLVGNKPFKKIYVSWFGAEPLSAMSQIVEISKKLMEYARQKEIPYGARVVTNGLNLTLENFNTLAGELGVDFIEITLDGAQEFHDSRRKTKKNLPTFEKIFNNILLVVNSDYYDKVNCRLSVRCNVDARNFPGVSPLIDLLAKNQLQNKISFYVAPIHSWGNDANQLSLEKSEFAEKEIEWIIKLKKYGFKFPLLPSRKPIVCMAAKQNSELIDAFGNVYNCTEISYVPKYENDSSYFLGNLNLGMNQSTIRKFSDFNDSILQNMSLPCSSCEMLPVCGGGCPKSWEEGHQACPSNKFNIESKLLMAYAEYRGGFRSHNQIKIGPEIIS